MNYSALRSFPGKAVCFLLAFLLMQFPLLYGQNNCAVSVQTTAPSCNGNTDGKANVFINGQLGGSAVPCLTPPVNSIDCSSGCNLTVSTNVAVTVAAGQKVCITATNFTNTITFTGAGTLVVCGTIAPSSVSAGTNAATIIVTKTGSATFNTSLTSFGNLIVKNFGIMNVNGATVTTSGPWENSGTLNTKNFSPSGTFTNYSTMTVTGTLTPGNNFSNGGTLTVTGALINNSSNFVNQCHMSVGGGLSNAAGKIITNTGGIQVTGTTTINGSSSTYKGDAASRLVTDNLQTVSGAIIQGISTGSVCGSIKVNATTNLVSGSQVTGRIDICDAGTVETRSATITSPATVSANNACACTTIGATYTWATPLQNTTGPSASNIAPGNYSVSVKPAGCISAVNNTFTITAPPVLSASATVTNNNLATAVVSGGTPPYTYSWSGATGTANTQTYTQPGNYVLTVKDSRNCSDTGNFTVNCVFTIKTTPTTCSYTSDGTATIFFNGDTLRSGPGPQPGTPATCMTPGTNTVTCASGCNTTVSSNTGSVTVANGQKVCITASAFTGDITIGTGGGTLVICGNATPGNFNFNGNPLTMIVTGSATFASLNVLANVTVKNYGTLTCTGSSGFNGLLENHGTFIAKGDLSINAPAGQLLNTNNLQVQGSFNNFNLATNGGTMTVAGYFQNNGGSGLINKCKLSVGIDLNNSTTITNQGNINVTGWTRINGGSTYKGDANSWLVTTNFQADATVQGIGTSCATIQVSSQTILNPSSTLSGLIDICDANGIEWKKGQILAPASTNCSCHPNISWNPPLSGSSNPYKGLSGGTYTVTISAAGCPNSVNQTFTIASPPPITTSIQLSGKTATVTASGGTGALTYTWSGGTGTGNVRTFVNFGRYTVTVKDSKNCSKTDTITIGDVPPPICIPGVKVNVSFTTDNKVVITCDGGCPVITATGTLPAGTPIAISAGVDTVINVKTVCQPLAIPVKRETGCYGSVTLTPKNPTCDGFKNGRIDASFTGTGTATYLWNGPGTSNVSGSFIQNVGAGNYFLTVTPGSCSGKTWHAGISLFGPAPLEAFYQVTGTNTVNIIVKNGVPNYQVKWQDNLVADSRSDLQPGKTYTVFITDANGCTLTYTFLYGDACAVNPVKVYVVVNGTNATPVVSGGSGGYTYSWVSVPPGIILANPLLPNQTNLPNGVFDLTVTDDANNQCKATARVRIPGCGLNITPTVTAPSCSTTCNGQISITVPHGAHVVWDNNALASEPVLLNACAGKHTVRVITPQTTTDPGGCAVEIPVTLTSSNASCPTSSCTSNPVKASVKTQRDKQCFSDQGLVDVQVTGGTPPYTYTWKSPSPGGTEEFVSSSEDLLNPLPGIYTLVVKDTRGCPSDTLTITVGGPSSTLKAGAIVTNSSCAGGTASATMVISGGVAPYQVKWPDGNTSLTDPDLSSGTYTVTIKDAAGCTITSTVAVTTTPFNGNVRASLNKFCPAKESVILTAAPVSGYTYSWSGPGITGLYALQSLETRLAGTYTVQYLRAGCATRSASFKLDTLCAPKKKDTLSCNPVTLTDIPVDYPAPCIAQQVASAKTYASYRYQVYLEEQKRKFKTDFINTILAQSQESLNMSYSDQEFSYTLYYYDRAGNLVRTVPPAGVHALDAQQESQAENDLKNNTRSLFTTHTLASTYKYNSLNQVIAQDVPDNNKQAIWETANAAINLSGLNVASLAFNTSGNGLLFANSTGYGGFFTSTDTGKTWNQLQNPGVSDVLDIQRVDANNAFAAGNNGIFLRSKDGGQHWVIKATPAQGKLVKINFTSASAGWILNETGSVWRTPNAGDTWIQEAAPAGIGPILDAWFETNALWATGAGGNIWKATYNGSSWTWAAQTTFRPGKVNAITSDGSNYLLAGPVGSLFTENTSGDIGAAHTNLTQETFKIGKSGSNALLAIAGTSQVLYTDNGSRSQWTAVAAQTGVNQLLSFTRSASNVDLATTSGGSIAQNLGSGWSAFAATGLTQINSIRYASSTGNVLLAGGNKVAFISGTSSGFTTFSSWTQITVSNLTQVNDIWQTSGNALILLSGGTVYTVALPAGATATATSTGVSGVQAFYPSGSTLYAVFSNRSIQTTTNGSVWTSALASLPGTANLVDLNIQSGTSATATFDNQDVWRFSSGAWSNITGNVRPSSLNAIQATGGTGYAAGSNGEIYTLSGSGWTYLPYYLTASVPVLNFSDLSVNTGGTLFLSAGNNIYSYSAAALLQQNTSGLGGNVTRMDTEGTYLLAGTQAGGLYAKSGATEWSLAPGTVPVYAVDATSAGQDLAAGQNGAIFMGEPFTSSWTQVAPPLFADPINAVAFGNNTEATAVGNSGAIFTTTDAGQTWIPRYSGTNNNLVSVTAYTSSSTHMAVTGGINGTLLKTSDGGATWQAATTPVLGTSVVRAVRTANGSTVLAIADKRILKSITNGASFTDEGVTLPQNGNGLWLDADGYGFLVGDNSMAYRITPNGTNSFTYISIAADNDLTDARGTGIPVGAALRTVQFTDRLTGYITGTSASNQGIVLKTTDGGLTWSSEGAGTGAGIPLISLADGSRGSILKADGSVATLHDQAETLSSRFWYDEASRIVLSQNSKQFNIEAYINPSDYPALTGNGPIRAYSYTLYDDINRAKEVGELLTRQAPPLRNQLGSQVFYAKVENEFVASGVRREITRTYYDEGIFTSIVAGFLPGFEQNNLRSRVASTTYFDTDNSIFLYDRATHYSYDEHGNAQTVVNEIWDGNNTLIKRIDHEYDLISNKVNYVYYQKDQPDQFIHHYQYDADNRIIAVETSRDGIVWDRDASYQYFGHGPLTHTEIGQQKVEICDYAYTLQGRIKGSIGQNFSYGLGYFTGDYLAINGLQNGLQSTPIAAGRDLYNGNIATVASNTPAFTTTQALTQQFVYDQLNRINQSSVNGAGNNFKTTYGFDGSGNITSLERYDQGGARFDQLNYNYEQKGNGYRKNTNKLRWLSDGAAAGLNSTDIDNQSQDNYGYDDIGNLKQDITEEIANVDWTPQGKIKRITRTAASTKPDIAFTYDAMGNRISKKIIQKNGAVSGTYYLRDATGDLLAVYQQEAADVPVILVENYIYGIHRLGVSRPDETMANIPVSGAEVSYNSIHGLKEYEITDYLQDVRVVLGDLRQTTGSAAVLAATDYYPYGMIMRTIQNSNLYRFGFNGAEKDNEIKSTDGSSYSFSARIYDPRAGRFLSVDPLTRDYPWYTPYQFAGNKPIQFLDLEGLEEDGYQDPYKDLGVRIFLTTFYDARIGMDNLVLRALDVTGIKKADPGMKWHADYKKNEKGEEIFAVEIKQVPKEGAIKEAVNIALDVVSVAGAVSPTKETGLFAKTPFKSQVARTLRSSIPKIEEFYRDLAKLKVNERVAKLRETAEDVAKSNGWKRNKQLEKLNKGRTIYTDEKGIHYSLDTQHGTFEVLDAKGRHKGEIDFAGEQKKDLDTSGKHDINVK